MSNLEATPSEGEAQLSPSVLLPREVPLGGPRALIVRRTLPHRARRMIGPWCFIDHYGPVSNASMDVPPHPHTGLQTVSWLLSGSIDHTDSLGFHQTIKPGQLNLMTAGRAIAHAEVSHGEELHGVQLWVALPESARHQEPHFEHHEDLPVVTVNGAQATVIMGTLADQTSPAKSYSPIVGAEITLTANTAQFPLADELEYGVLSLDEAAVINGQALPALALLDLGIGNPTLTIEGRPGSKFLLIGGAPFKEEILMWWNFVGRSHEEIIQMREDWQMQTGYSPVDFPEERLQAPALPLTRLKARGA